MLALFPLNGLVSIKYAWSSAEGSWQWGNMNGLTSWYWQARRQRWIGGKGQKVTSEQKSAYRPSEDIVKAWSAAKIFFSETPLYLQYRLFHQSIATFYSIDLNIVMLFYPPNLPDQSSTFFWGCDAPSPPTYSTVATSLGLRHCHIFYIFHISDIYHMAQSAQKQ